MLRGAFWLTLGLWLSGCGYSSLHYVASKKSNVFHRSDCAEAGHIKPQNRLDYPRREEAATDHRPCEVCKP